MSVRRVEDVTEALWGRARVSPSTASELNQKISAQIETWRNLPIEGDNVCVYLDGSSLKRCWGGELRNVSLPEAIGVNEEVFAKCWPWPKDRRKTRQVGQKWLMTGVRVKALSQFRVLGSLEWAGWQPAGKN